MSARASYPSPGSQPHAQLHVILAMSWDPLLSWSLGWAYAPRKDDQNQFLNIRQKAVRVSFSLQGWTPRTMAACCFWGISCHHVDKSVGGLGRCKHNQEMAQETGRWRHTDVKETPVWATSDPLGLCPYSSHRYQDQFCAGFAQHCEDRICDMCHPQTSLWLHWVPFLPRGFFLVGHLWELLSTPMHHPSMWEESTPMGHAWWIQERANESMPPSSVSGKDSSEMLWKALLKIP